MEHAIFRGNAIDEYGCQHKDELWWLVPFDIIVKIDRERQIDVPHVFFSLTGLYAYFIHNAREVAIVSQSNNRWDKHLVEQQQGKEDKEYLFRGQANLQIILLVLTQTIQQPMG